MLMLLRSKKRNMLLDRRRQIWHGLTCGCWSPVPESRGRVIISASDFHQSLVRTQDVSDNVISFRLLIPKKTKKKQFDEVNVSWAPGTQAQKSANFRARLVHVFKNWKLLFKIFYGNTCGWKSVLKYVKCCLKTENCCLKTLTKHPLKLRMDTSIFPFFLFFFRIYIFFNT